MDKRVHAVQRMQDHVEASLDGEITMAALAAASGFSPWYSYRLFRQYTGLTPADYVRRLRLSRSALRLRDEKCSVTDAAFDLGFGSVEGYQRAFRREFGCNPGEYARNPVPVPLFIAYGVKFRELGRRHMGKQDIRNVFIQVVHKPERRLLLKRGKKAKDYFAYCEEVGCDIWGLLKSVKGLGEPMGLWLPEKLRRAGTSVYVQGVEVARDYAGPVPEGLDMVRLPAADYLMFQGEPFREEDYCAAIEAVQEAMDRYEPSVTGYKWDDGNPRMQLEPIGKRGYIELRAVKSVKRR
ncbi:MAG: AraC family transcriptional regulator [Elusimicrobiales bacterium]|nr:AraC family transcriptional regulator [Elusimicrobiales bacterium]